MLHLAAILRPVVVVLDVASTGHLDMQEHLVVSPVPVPGEDKAIFLKLNLKLKRGSLKKDDIPNSYQH